MVLVDEGAGQGCGHEDQEDDGGEAGVVDAVVIVFVEGKGAGKACFELEEAWDLS